MDRIVVARIVGVVGFVCAGAPLDALAQQCVNTASPQCAYVASQVGDFEVMEDGGVRLTAKSRTNPGCAARSVGFRACPNNRKGTATRDF